MLLIRLIAILMLKGFNLVFEFAMATILVLHLLAPHCILEHRLLTLLLITRWHATTMIGLRTLFYETSSEILN